MMFVNYFSPLPTALLKFKLITDNEKELNWTKSIRYYVEKCSSEILPRISIIPGECIAYLMGCNHLLQYFKVQTYS